MTAVAALATVSAPACADETRDVIAGFAVHLGASLNEAGVVLEVPGCYGHAVKTIIVYETDEEKPIWRVDSVGDLGRPLNRVIVGQAPTGFEESSQLTTLPERGTLHAVVVGDLRGNGNPIASATFSISSIRREPLPSGCGEL